MTKKKSQKAKVASPSPNAAKSRQLREQLTRVGITTRPIQGKETNAKQWDRWTP